MSRRNLPDTMRAWMSGDEPGIDHLRISETPVPSPGENELLLRVEAAALNFSDLLMIDGVYQVRPPRPFVPGQEIAGTVVEAGARSGLETGARIASKVLWGGFADFAIVRADMAIPTPKDFDSLRAAALPVVYPTAIVALMECTRIEPGETVLVHAAAGGVGLASVQIAKSLGAVVIATAGSDEKCKIAKANGADHAINYKTADWVAAVREATGGDGADVIVDPVGGEITEQSLRCIAWEGRLLIVGFSSGEIPAIPANRLLLRRASAIGVYWNHDRDREMMRRVTDRMATLCAEGRIEPTIGARYAFDDLPKALEALRDRGSVGKLVLDLDRG
jgi:NADPH2:quinone reductase